MAVCTSTSEKKTFRAISWTFENIVDATTLRKSKKAEFRLPECSPLADFGRPVFQALARIRQLGMYENGWYLPESLGPTYQTVKDAESFIFSIKNWDHIEQPFIGLAEDGEISFLWENEHIEIDLGFYGTNTYSYYAKFLDGTERLEDKVPASEPLPEEILACLKV